MKLQNLSLSTASGLLGLLLACSVFTSPSVLAQGIAGTNDVGNSDFDAGGVWSYGYYYSWGWPQGNQFTDGTWANNYAYADTSPGNGTVVGAYYFTNATMSDLMTNAGAGYGTGFGG